MPASSVPATVWAVFGLLLLTCEILTLTFVLLFFGVSALLVAGLKAVFGLDNLTLELLAFAFGGAICIFFFRGRLRRALHRDKPRATSDQERIIQLSNRIAPHGTAKVEYQGALWDAINDSDEQLELGMKVIIVKTDGIKLVVRPIPLP